MIFAFTWKNYYKQTAFAYILSLPFCAKLLIIPDSANLLSYTQTAFSAIPDSAEGLNLHPEKEYLPLSHCCFQDIRILIDVPQFKFQQTTLADSKKITRTAKLQILSCNIKSIIGFVQNLQTLEISFAPFPCIKMQYD